MLAIAAATAPRTTPPETGAATARPQRQRCEHHDDEAPRRTEGWSRRGNALVSAMMSALDGLMPDSASAAPRSEALKDSATAFAHELFDALRSSSDVGNGRGFAWGRREHHHRHGGGYDGLAQRLDRLAAQVDTPAATATSTTTISASLSSASFSASVDVDGDGDGTSTSVSLSASVTTLQIDITQQTGTAATESPLQAAFRKLFDALQPATAPGTAAAAPGASSSLSSFLRQLADGLRNGSGADDHTTAPATGSLLSLAA